MRRAGSVAERTENAAVARVRTQAREAAGADEEVHAGVLRHFCLRIQAAHRTCERSRLHTPLSVELISNDNRALRRTSGVTSNIRAWDCAFSRGHRAVDLSQHGAVHQDALPGCPSPLQRNRRKPAYPSSAGTCHEPQILPRPGGTAIVNRSIGPGCGRTTRA
jgi:hypothetical protein